MVALSQQLLARDGVVVGISSDAAVQHYETWGGYGASKAALDHLVLTFGAETGLSTYAVDPGDMRTPMHQAAFPGEDISDRPLPEVVAPRFLELLARRPESGRYLAEVVRRQRGGLGMTILSERSGVRFHTTPESTAVAPPEVRGSSRDDVRLLVARPDAVEHHHFHDLPDLLEPGDLVVVNNSATVNGEIDAVRGGSPIVLHAATRLDAHTWVVELRTAPDAADPILDALAGETIGVGELPVTLLEPYPHPDSSPTGSGNRLWRAEAEGDLRRLLDRHGRPIAYGYLDRRYPLAGVPVRLRHDTRQRRDGLRRAPVHLGPGDLAGRSWHRRSPRSRCTPGVSSQEAGEGPQPEWYHVPAPTARLVELTRTHGGRVVATGTTVTRALESAVIDGTVRESWGWTERVVTPAHPPVVVNGLITGWHDAQASHLLLVEAIAGTDLAQAAYDSPRDRGSTAGTSSATRACSALPRRSGARDDATSGVLRVLAGDEEDDASGDRDGVVGDPLVVATEQGDVDGRLDAVLPVRAEQLAERGAAQAVHLLVDLLELLGGGHVGVGDHVLDLADHHLGDRGHPRDRRDDLVGHGDVGDAQAGDLGDVHGEVAHPLELADHPQRRDQHPQVAGDGVLQREQLEAVLLELLAQVVDR